MIGGSKMPNFGGSELPLMFATRHFATAKPERDMNIEIFAVEDHIMVHGHDGVHNHS